MKGRGFGRLYQRGRIWWVQYSFRGKVYRESSGSAKRTNAVKLLRRRLEEMGRGRLVGPDVERTTFEDLGEMLLNEYRVNGRKSLYRAETSLKALHAFFQGTHAVDITFDRLAAYINGRLDAGKRPATIRRELAQLPQFEGLR